MSPRPLHAINPPGQYEIQWPPANPLGDSLEHLQLALPVRIGTCAPDDIGPYVTIGGKRRTHNRRPRFRLSGNESVVGFKQSGSPLVCQLVAPEPAPSYSSWRRSQNTGESSSLRPIGVQGGGNLVIMRSGELIRSLLSHGLIDEFVLMIHPLVLGCGRRLFEDDGKQFVLRPLDGTATDSGVVLETYGPA